jgi:hypothetical protein
MLGELLFKELREHLLAFRLQLGVALTLVLVATSALVLVSGYKRERAEGIQAGRAEDDFARQYAHLNRIAGVLQTRRPPARLMLIRGLPADAGIETLETDPMRELFAPMDLTFIVGVLLSLLGIILGFDAVNGEKERGTLRQILANPVRRADVILAKWLAGLLVICATFATALLLAAVIVNILAAGVFTPDEWMSYAAVAGVSFLYCAVFFTIGLAASTLARLSRVSVLTALFVWVVFVLIVPNISPYVAAQIVRLPAVAALERDVQYTTSEERDELGRIQSRAVMARYGDVTAAVGSASGEALKQRLAADPRLRTRYESMRSEAEAVWKDVNRRQNAKAGRLIEAWQGRLRRQMELSRILASASPLSSLTFALTELADCGFGGAERFSRQAKAYGQTLSEYLDRRYREEQARNPTHSFNDYLDVNDRPRFRYQAPTFGERLAAALPHTGLLAGWSALFLLASVMGFQRFDVR